MTVYARSDVVHVALSAAHGGCGAAHSRPVTHGAPAKEWALSCGPCEAHLRHDPNWAAFPSEVPETPDEARVREDREGKGALDRDNQLLQALVTLARSNEGIQQLLVAGGGVDAPALAVTCSSGHLNPGTGRFCADCGERLGDPVSPPVESRFTTMVTAATVGERSKKAERPLDMEKLRRLTAREVRELATQRGVVATGTKANVIARLTAA
jgi:hypothetical protein